MDNESTTGFFINDNNTRSNRPTKARVNQNVGDEKISKMTSVIFNPQNLKMYQIIFIIIFIIYIWLTEFASVTLIVKSLLLVSLIALLAVESIIVLSYIE